jgi:hypothetical protein
MGSSAVMLWRRLETYITEIRNDLDNPAAFEWFQWLAETLETLQDSDQAPAYELYKDWKPSGLTPEI